VICLNYVFFVIIHDRVNIKSRYKKPKGVGVIKKGLEDTKTLLRGYTTRAVWVFSLIIVSVILFISLVISSSICTQQDCFMFFVDRGSLFSDALIKKLCTLPALYVRCYIGIGAYAIVFFCLYLAYIIFCRKTLLQECDRICAFILLIMSVPALSLDYISDSFQALYASGFGGLWLYTTLASAHDVVIVHRFLQCTSLLSMVIISRFTLTGWLSLCISAYFYKKTPVFITRQSFNPPVDPVIDDTDTTVVEQEIVISLQEGPQQDEDQEAYELPRGIFSPTPYEQHDPNQDSLQKQVLILEDKLSHFGIKGNVLEIKEGPVVTLFEYQPEVDSKISKIIALEDDLALALQAMSIRIIAPVPGTSVVGFEVANQERKDVLLSHAIESKEFHTFAETLPIILGKDTTGNDVIVDLTRMPHLLVAGSTGSGKSVALNSFLISLLCKRTPEELRLILIDPKRLEFSPYANIAHLIFPIVTEVNKVAPTLRWVIHEMERRYELMAQSGVRNIADYSERTTQESGTPPLPYIVIVIDELADVMMLASKEVEALIARITQMARAAGIHMIIATQRPSVDVITGVIKVNFPSRISFRVTSKIDSRTILDVGGAEKLLGNGDMLFLNSSSCILKRVHGAYISDAQIHEITSHIRHQRTVSYEEGVPLTESLEENHTDQLYDEVKKYVQTIQEVSISLVQRKFRIGYNRSARIIEMLETDGIIRPSRGGKTRKVVQ
jgi:hypothetical protein